MSEISLSARYSRGAALGTQRGSANKAVTESRSARLPTLWFAAYARRDQPHHDDAFFSLLTSQPKFGFDPVDRRRPTVKNLWDVEYDGESRDRCGQRFPTPSLLPLEASRLIVR